jgi:ribonuclease HI
LRIFVDGSFSPDFDRAGWAFVAVENGAELASGYGITPYPAESRNIDGELMALTKPWSG